jgi:hypothetical protein
MAPWYVEEVFNFAVNWVDREADASQQRLLAILALD